MKVEQESVEFNPITLTLETREEASRFVGGIDNYLAKHSHCISEKTKKLFLDIANCFSNDLRF